MDVLKPLMWEKKFPNKTLHTGPLRMRLTGKMMSTVIKTRVT